MLCPLEGIKVLDLSIAVATPLGATMLGDMGAEVIKVERVQGEAQRLGMPAGMDNVMDTSIGEEALDKTGWMAVNRGKKDLAIDIRTDKGKEIILKLARDADVILQSFRPGVAERLGVGYEQIAEIKQSSESQAVLSKKYGVSQGTISNLINNKTYVEGFNYG